MKTKEIVLAGGCFWCIEPVFKKLKGIQSIACGYTGGNSDQPKYDEICTGETGHAEAIKLEYDEQQITLADILDVFFIIHDPTTMNRQGADIGSQYRSAIFYKNEEEKKTAEKTIFKTEASKLWSNSIVTTIEPLTFFYLAEEYHQDFFAKNPSNRYCQIATSTKFKKLNDTYIKLLNLNR